MPASEAERVRTEPLRPGECACLLLAVPPVLVMVLASLVFEFSAFNISEVARVVAAQLSGGAPAGLVHVLEETRARFLWSTTVLLSVFAGCYLLVLAGIVLRRSLSSGGLRLFVPLGLLLGLGGIGHLLYSAWSDSPLSAIFSFTFESLRASGRFEAPQLEAIRVAVSFLNGLGVVAPAAALMAGCSTLAPPPAGRDCDAAHLEAQMRRLKNLLNAGSALLVIGILHMNVWLRWPAALVDDAVVGAKIVGLSTALSVFWGAAFSLLIVAFYLPAAVLLSRRAEAALARAPAGGQRLDVGDWLKRHGLAMTPSQQLPQLAAMLAPLLAGPVGSALGNLASPVGS